MRLLFVIKSLSNVGGGAERVFVKIANQLRDRGHAVSVMTFDGAGESFYELSSGIGRLGLGYVEGGYPMSGLRVLRSLWGLRRSIRRTTPDVVVAFMHSAYVPVGLALAATNIPVVASEHTTYAHFRARTIDRIAITVTSKCFEAIVTVSEASYASYPVWLRRGLQVIENPVDLSAFSPTELPSSHSSEQVILVVGNFRVEKAHADAIAAFAQIAGDFPRAVLRLVGDGVLRPELERQVAELGLAGRVQMPGVVRDISGEYAHSLFVMVTSTYESFGLAAVEAMAAGRPVMVAESCAAVSNLIEHGKTGWVVNSEGDRVAAFAGGMRSLLRDRALLCRLSSAAPGAVARFGGSHAVDAWEKLLSESAGRSK